MCLWKCSSDYRSLDCCFSVALVGVGDGGGNLVTYHSSGFVYSKQLFPCWLLCQFPECHVSIQCFLCLSLQCGFINCLQFAQSGEHLVAGVGQEHRLGRWWRDSSVRNGVAVIPLPRTQNNT